MPTGFAGIAEYAEKTSRNKESSDFQPVLFVKLPDDEDTAKVRFLEQGDDVFYYFYHDYSDIDERNGWMDRIPCLDQDLEGTNPCPGCKEGLPRKFQGYINVIWRDAPVFKRGDDGKVVKKNKQPVVEGYEDQIAIWRGGRDNFNKVLKRKDITFKGLSSRDFEITRDGLGLETKYSIEPADPDAGAVKMSKADLELAKEKYDLSSVARLDLSYENAEKIMNKHIAKYKGEEEDDDIEGFLDEEPFKK